MFLRLLCGIAVTLTLVALARILNEKMLVQQRRKEKRGHFCARLYAKNLVSISDLKQLNRAWYNLRDRRPDYNLLLDAYDKQFYKVKSSNVQKITIWSDGDDFCSKSIALTRSIFSKFMRTNKRMNARN